jgi:hypothetical protein
MSLILKILSLLCFIFLSSRAIAVEVNSLQAGLSGPGYLWSVVDGFQSEAKIDISKVYGSSTWSDSPAERLSAKTMATNVKAATAFKPSKDFVAMAEAGINSSTHQQSMRVENSSYSSSQNHYQFMFKSVLDRKKWIAGTSVGILTIGSEKKILNFNGQRRTVSLESVTLPIFELAGGVRYYAFETMAKMRLFSGDTAQGSTSDRFGQTRDFDVMRVSPAAFNVATSWNGISQLMLVGEINYEALGQLGETTNQYSSTYLDSGERVAGGANKMAGSWAFTGGGKFFPSNDFSVKASVTWRLASSRSPEYASHELDNLGGWNLEGGCEFIPDSNQKLGVTFGYTIPRSLSFKNRFVDPDKEMEVPRTPGSTQNMTSASWQGAIASTWTF